MDYITISLVMLVREGEDRPLNQCLMNVKDYVDEIIVVVDKGATSETAKRFGAKIVPFEWCDDFSAARNEGLKYATKDWILVLDADEILAKDDLLRLKKMALDNEDVIAYTLNQLTYTHDTNQQKFIKDSNFFTEKFGFPGYITFQAIRFFKNHLGLKFSRRVHELLDDSIVEKGLLSKTENSGIPIHHLKMLKNDFRETEQRYMMLSEKEIEDNPQNYKAYFDAGLINFVENGPLEKSEKYFRKCLEIKPDFFEARVALGCLLYAKKEFENALSEFEKALGTEKNPHLYANMGSCLTMLKRDKEALACFEKALKLGHPNKGDISSKIRHIQGIL